jgi:hypothetical protein
VSQGSSKPTASVAAQAQEPKPAVDTRGPTARDNSRPLARRKVHGDTGNAGRTSPDGLANKQDAARLQSYAQWAGFTDAAPGGEFGFGAYFEGGANSAQSSSLKTEYTWTPSRRG